MKQKAFLLMVDSLARAQPRSGKPRGSASWVGGSAKTPTTVLSAGGPTWGNICLLSEEERMHVWIKCTGSSDKF